MPILTILISNFNLYKRFIIPIFLIVILFFSHLYFYNKGYDNSEEKNNQIREEQIVKALEKQKEDYDNQIQKIKDNIKVEERIKIVYQDRIKTVKEIVKQDNFKCEMTDEQIKQLNSFKIYKD